MAEGFKHIVDGDERELIDGADRFIMAGGDQLVVKFGVQLGVAAILPDPLFHLFYIFIQLQDLFFGDAKRSQGGSRGFQKESEFQKVVNGTFVFDQAAHHGSYRFVKGGVADIGSGSAYFQITGTLQGAERFPDGSAAYLETVGKSLFRRKSGPRRKFAG